MRVNFNKAIIQMPADIQKLSEYVQKIKKDKKYTFRQIAVQSGGEISDGYVTLIANQKAKPESISGAKLKALAKGLKVPEEEVFAAARGTKPDEEKAISERFEIASLKFQQIDGQKRQDAEALFQALERLIELREH